MILLLPGKDTARPHRCQQGNPLPQPRREFWGLSFATFRCGINEIRCGINEIVQDGEVPFANRA